MAKFGFRVLMANIANWIILYIDQAVVGARFGAINLGFYSRSYFLVTTPTTILQTSAQTSLLSAISRMGKSPETIKLFRGFMSLFAFLFFAIYTLIALESVQIILLIYGKEWLPAAPLLAPLALAMPFHALVSLEGPVLLGLGKPEYELRAQWLTAFVAVAALLAASSISLEATAWAILFIYTFRWLVMSLMTRKILDVSMLIITRPLVSGLLLAGVAWMGWSLADVIIPSTWPIAAFSMIRVMTSLATLLMFFWFTRKWLFPEFLAFGKSWLSIFRQA
jgi:PST family polysaccharide transporter